MIALARAHKRAANARHASNAPSVELNLVPLPDRVVSVPPRPKPRKVIPDVEITDATPSIVFNSQSNRDSDSAADAPPRLADLAKPENLERALAAMVNGELGDAHVLVQAKPDEIRLFVSPSQNRRRSGRAYRRSVPKLSPSQNRKRTPSIPDRHDNVSDSRPSEMVGRYNIWD
jgi:hypothetical protein